MNPDHLKQLQEWGWHVHYTPEIYTNLSPEPADCPYLAIFKDASVGFFRVLPTGKLTYGSSEFISQTRARDIARTSRGHRILLDIDPRLRVSEGL